MTNQESLTMTKLMNLIMILGLFSLLLISCGKSLLFHNQEPRNDWLASWLSNPVCQPPCWENIIPGKTSLNEAVNILTNMDGVNILLFPIKDTTSEMRQMDWTFERIKDNAGIQTDKYGNLVSKIYFNINQILTIEEVEKKFGFPSNVMLYDCRSENSRKTCEVHLVYRNASMVLELFLNDRGNADHKVMISPNSEIYRIDFLEGNENSYLNLIGKNSFNYPELLLNWKGYTNYP